MDRPLAESVALIDRIVGRCVRDRTFARRVVDNPEAALSDYCLTDAEMEDFLSLRNLLPHDEILRIWAETGHRFEVALAASRRSAARTGK